MTTAMFSILAPRKRIPPHDGPYKGVLRYHLGPAWCPEPARSCGDHAWAASSRTGSEGGSLVFDDTYAHEAWNDTDGTRVVLFVDVIRELRGPTAHAQPRC